MTATANPMNIAQRIVAHSMRPSFICNWNQAARASYGGTRDTKRANVIRFADGSAVTFNANGKPIEFIG